jgi:hypothetical protein
MESVMAHSSDVKSRDVWIGHALVHQRPGAGVLMDENDAYVQTLALASNHSEFHEAVRRAFDSLGFDLVELEDVEPLAMRLQRSTVHESLLAKAAEVQNTGFPRFGPFVTWASDD